ncbi:tumor necrosis factor receptor superfamily member 26 [Biomphalaria glabrata]|nr:tumor necrosis factor receptor superfamily member 26 [Biomphalaria glabrata]
MGDKPKYYSVIVFVFYGITLDHLNYANGAVLHCHSSYLCASGKCGAGEFFAPHNGVCEPCGNNTHMNSTQHACLCCNPCTFPAAGSGMAILKACSPTSDAVIGCPPNYALDLLGTCKSLLSYGLAHQQVRRVCDDFQGIDCMTPGSDPTMSPEKYTFRMSAIIVGSIAGSLIIIPIITGICIYCKAKGKAYKYPQKRQFI